MKTLEVLGTTFTIGGSLSIPAAKCSAYRNWSTPNSYRAVKSFIFSVSFYRNHLPFFADKVSLLLELGNKGNITKTNKKIPKFHWTEEHNKAFVDIKDMIPNHIYNNIPDQSKEFHLQTDASNKAVGCLVTQKDEKVTVIPIAATSRILSPTERLYSVHKRECLAVLYALKSLDIFLNGSNIKLQCDASH